MHTELKHLVGLFKGVGELRGVVKEHCHFPDMERTSIDDLVYAFGAYYGVGIEFYLSPDLKDELLRGVYLRNGKKVHIYIDRSLSEDWIKYIQVKEMCNLILGDDEYMTQDPAVLLELMIYEESSPLEGDAPLDLVSDFWAKYAAHEFLFPYEYREKAKQSISAGEEDLFSLGQHYGVPEHVVELCLSEPYNALCKDAWDEIHAERECLP